MLLQNIRNKLYSDAASHLKKQNPHVQFNNIQQNSRKPSHKFTRDNGHYPKESTQSVTFWTHMCIHEVQQSPGSLNIENAQCNKKMNITHII